MLKPMLAALLGIWTCASAARAQTADEIIAKNLAARGGIEKMRAIRTMVVTGKLETPGGSGPIRVSLRRPGHIQEVLALGGAQSVRTFDGKSGWVLKRGEGHEDVMQLGGGDLENLADEGANGIDGSLADYKKKGNSVEFDGAAVLPDGALCYKLKVKLRSGHVQYLYLDTRSFLEIREEIVRSINGKETIIEETIGGYREEGGILFPHTYVSGLKGSAQKTTLAIERMELNPTLDDALFQKPF